MNRWLCGVPIQYCQGAATKTSSGLRIDKSHSSPHEAFRCMSHYLVSVEGYEQIGGREFRKEGHPIRVLTKKTRFGARLRTGKNQERMMPENNAVIIG